MNWHDIGNWESFIYGVLVGICICVGLAIFFHPVVQ